MNIKVIREKSPSDVTANTGGEYAIFSLDVYVDENLSLRTQRTIATHAVIENYCRSWTHDKVEELCDLIQDVLDQLNNE